MKHIMRRNLTLITVSLLLLIARPPHASSGALDMTMEEMEVTCMSNSKLFREFSSLPELVMHTQAAEPVPLNKQEEGKWLILHFWATWCPPCLVGMPGLLEFQKKVDKDKIEVRIVSLDYPELTPESIKSAGLPADIDTLHAPDAVTWTQLADMALPTTVYVSPDGVIRRVFSGTTRWMSDETMASVNELIQNYEQ